MLLVASLLISGLFNHVGCEAFSIQPNTWLYKGHAIGYEVAGGTPSDQPTQKSQSTSDKVELEEEDEPILLLNGFGVGSFHQHRLISNLISQGEHTHHDSEEYSSGVKSNSRVVYGVDYLGQGRSWPVDCDDGESDNERGLRYCVNMWADQIIDFIEDIIKPSCKVHVVGNSVGGYLAVVLSLKRPDLVSSITLLNATPVWGANLPGWSGHLPAPAIPKWIGRYLFDRIRDERTIETYLSTAYANRDAFDETLVRQIRSCTEGRGGHAAFASIMWSPPAAIPTATDFYSMLSQVECDVLLVFGKDDPWCKPAFAKKMMMALNERELNNRPVHRYVELANVGHCPNHEAPQAVGKTVTRWITARDRNKESLTLVDRDGIVVQEPWGEVEMREVGLDEASIGLLDKIVIGLVG